MRPARKHKESWSTCQKSIDNLVELCLFLYFNLMTPHSINHPMATQRLHSQVLTPWLQSCHPQSERDSLPFPLSIPGAGQGLHEKPRSSMAHTNAETPGSCPDSHKSQWAEHGGQQMLHCSVPTLIPTLQPEQCQSAGALLSSWGLEFSPSPQTLHFSIKGCLFLWFPLSSRGPALTPGTEDIAHRVTAEGFPCTRSSFPSPCGDTGALSSLLYSTRCLRSESEHQPGAGEGLQREARNKKGTTKHLCWRRKVSASVAHHHSLWEGHTRVLFSSFCPSQVSHCCY